ncbi:chemotaxis protein CheA [Arcobacter sp. FWKO B]|uniref:chemotaxis protein CheA n=1 Tax=Arcobacter sp. FWKO B TaxID=2593672 RepID=UPI0018A3E8CD|nr:chemotaxis protein CheA [Arcobacter sp. FWKO B]QOG11203.1 chemotaxis protein CheA [Arcobacter sp. FWKO B]
MNPILQQFLIEARENLLFLDKNLELLESNDGDIVNALFRAAHTLKGSSGLAGFDCVKEITHIAEDLLDAYRSDKIIYSDQLLRTLYDMFDEVAELVDIAEESGEITFIEQERVEEFKSSRAAILDLRDDIQDKQFCEFNIIDDVIPPFGNLFLNDFQRLDFNKLSFDTKAITKEEFETGGFYIIDLDLPKETLELGNDPFYSLYLLGEENVISIYIEVDESCENIAKNPIVWSSRIIAIVYSNQNDFENAFYNFMEDVSIYPLAIKSFFKTELDLKSSDCLKPLIADIKLFLENLDIDGLIDLLQGVSKDLQKDSLEYFLINRLCYILEVNDLNTELLNEMVGYVVDVLNIDELYTEVCDHNTTEDVIIASQKEKKASKPMAKMVKIDLDDVDKMMDIVGEMLVIKNSLPYIAQALNFENIEANRRELMARYDEINRVTIQLQEKVMEMRLLSLSFIFDRYPKLIRDISKSLGKKIKYVESGGDTKLDKTIIEKLADPLIHIIRNSLDHGIESPDIREQKGKSPEGTISIKAESLGDKVYVSIEDDGKGIDVQKVVQKALEKKMVDVEALEQMSEEEKLMLVFHPGVSTMEQISELSGRGVGMDVVRQSINEVGGKISLSSTVNVGTKLVLELPMSVALSNVFHIKLGNANYALSMDSIVETVQVPKNEVEYINQQPMLKLRGVLIPLVFYYKLLSSDIDSKDSYSLVIIQTQGQKFGFVVDEFVNQLDIVQKPLAPNFKNHPFISGTSLLGNGEVLFVINPSRLYTVKEKK